MNNNLDKKTIEEIKNYPLTSIELIPTNILKIELEWRNMRRYFCKKCKKLFKSEIKLVYDTIDNRLCDNCKETKK